MILKRNKITLSARAKLILGGPRRYFLRLFNPDYVDTQLAKRAGECKRCGACCQMSWRCPHLYYDADKLACCRLYGRQRRQSWCVDFPIDERCLNDRELAGFIEPCGYGWIKPKESDDVY
jgi:hypothetical protein